MKKRPTFFSTPASFRTWLVKNHRSSKELWVGYYKKATGKASIDWPQSRDQALCFGWIDGIRKSIDAESFMVRFTPRRPGSIWSAVNIARVKDLRRRRLMMPAGLEAFERRDPRKSERYSFEQVRASFTLAQQRTLKANGRAWAFFKKQPPSYRKLATWWVISAKKTETRERRLVTLINDSAAGLRIRPMRRTEEPGT